MYVLEAHVPEEKPHSSSDKAERDAYKKHVNDATNTAWLMFATMNFELQNQYDNMEVFDMMKHLKIIKSVLGMGGSKFLEPFFKEI